MQNHWMCLEKRDVSGCTNITDSDHILRDQLNNGLKAGPVLKALQGKVKAQLTTSFLIEAVDTTVAVTKRFEPAYNKGEALAPSPLSAMHTALMKLAQDLAALKQEVASIKRTHPNPLGARTPCTGTLKKTKNFGGVIAMDTYSRTVGGLDPGIYPGLC